MIDRGVIEHIGPTGIVRLLKFNEKFFKQHMSGFIFKSVFIMVISIILYINIIVYKKIEIEFTLQLLFIYCSIVLFKKIYKD